MLGQVRPHGHGGRIEIVGIPPSQGETIMSLEAWPTATTWGDENPYANGAYGNYVPMKECPDCEGYGKAGHFECGICSGTGEVYEEYEPCEGDVL